MTAKASSKTWWVAEANEAIDTHPGMLKIHGLFWLGGQGPQEREPFVLLGYGNKYKRRHSKMTEIDSPVGEKKDLLGMRLPKLSPGQQREEQNGGKTIRVCMSAGWGSWS